MARKGMPESLDDQGRSLRKVKSVLDSATKSIIPKSIQNILFTVGSRASYVLVSWNKYGP